MRHRNAPERRTQERHQAIAWATALATTLVLTLAQAAQAQLAPEVPTEIAVPEGNEAVLVGHAEGTQNYICLPAGRSVVWTLSTPQATLFDDEGQQLTTHFFSPSYWEPGTVRPTWQHSEDTSTVWAKLLASSTDPAYVSLGTIPWLLLEVTGALPGPTGGDALTATTFIHRVNTTGGVAPFVGCSKSRDIGKKLYVPYTADYVFYVDAGSL